VKELFIKHTAIRTSYAGRTTMHRDIGKRMIHVRNLPSLSLTLGLTKTIGGLLLQDRAAEGEAPEAQSKELHEGQVYLPINRLRPCFRVIFDLQFARGTQ
jgi:hypothetical protein